MRWIKRHVPQGDLWKNIPNFPLGPEQQRTPITTTTGSWTLVGPKPIDMTSQLSGYIFGTVIGRFDSLAIDTTTVGTPGSIVGYAGSPSGGLWKTTNCCNSSTTWASLWEGQNITTQGVGAIEIDPNNHNTIYAGTGDFDAADLFGEGIMKSTDAGSTWTQLGASVFTPYATSTPKWANQNVGSIKVDPKNSNFVLVGTRYDVYASTDAGSNWTRCPFGANPTDPTSAGNPTLSINRISGILLDSSTTPNTTVYVAVGYPFNDSASGSIFNGDNGVYKGTITGTGCPALSLISTGSNGWPVGTGNGTNGATNVGRIRLTSSKSTGNFVIYAQVENSTSTNALGTWVTTNQGTSWTQLTGSGDSSYQDCAAVATAENQDWYDLYILANPSNDKELYIGRVDLYKATVNAGYTSMTLTNLTTVYNNGTFGAANCPSTYGTAHPDEHAATWIGTTSNFLTGNDGGIYIATGAAGGFTQINSGINTTQWYAGQTGANLVGAATQYFFAGAQDNGNNSWDSSASNMTWKARNGGGDGFYTAFDALAGTLTAGYWLTEYPQGALYRSTTGVAPAGGAAAWTQAYGSWYGAMGCARCAWSSPFKIDNFHCTNSVCHNMIFGSQKLYVSDDGSFSWTSANTDLAATGGSIITLDFALSDPKTIAVGSDTGKVWWANDAYKDSGHGGNAPYCTVAAANTSNFGCNAQSPSWVALTNASLPNRVINGVTFDPTTNLKVYAAVGGFNVNASPNGHVFLATCTAGCASVTWTDKTGNLPDVPAESIVINPNNNKQAFLGTDMGFYYTNDITVSTPVWYRYNFGLPNTLIKYLTVDRGASATPLASTTLTAFTYGRGTYSIRLPGSSGFLPHPVPTDMKGTKSGSNVNITYTTSTCNNIDHNIYWGTIGNYTTITGGACNVGNSGTATNVAVPSGSWWVITGNDGSSVISSFGKDSTGAQENFSSWNAICASGATQNTSTTCP